MGTGSQTFRQRVCLWRGFRHSDAERRHTVHERSSVVGVYRHTAVGAHHQSRLPSLTPYWFHRLQHIPAVLCNTCD
ncbi:hypothetical protein AHF37_08091 [Paragonimus kellicotti]|nr:hypothetical protein AHF37_08091 [Paragonimus kellicotti]